jgi:hypothetical protein
MESRLIRQVRFLQAAVAVLLGVTGALCVNLFHPLLPKQTFKVIEAGRVNIREGNGVLKAALSNSAGFNEGYREAHGGVRFSGLMFYNEEGQETGGLVYYGKAIPGGQDADVTLTFDQYRQDQNVYLHHEERKDAQGLRIEDGLTINSRPDWTQVREEYDLYGQLEKLPAGQRDELQLKSLQEGKISSRRLFFGVERGVKDKQPYDDAGVFIKNRWGRNAIKLYVDERNEPHFEVYDQLGTSLLYELKLLKPTSK